MNTASARELYLQNHPDVDRTSLQLTSVSSNSDEPDQVDSYCKTDSAAEQTYLRVRRSVVDPKEASDSYGRRLGRHFLVFEVTVENNNPSLQYILHDVSVDLSRLNHMPLGTYRWAFSSQDLIMLRGVPEKGSDYDPRNLTYHIARGTGAVAGGVSGIVATGIQDVFAGAVAAFNGPLLTAFIDVFPDHTANQLNCLSDSAFTANGVVAKQSAKTFAIFVPEDLFMSRPEQNTYWKEPVALFANPLLDFRNADVCVDGAFISEVPALTLGSVRFYDPTKLKAKAQADVTIQGTNLEAGDTQVDIVSGGTFPLSSVEGASGAGAVGTTGHATITLPDDWTAQTTLQIQLESKKTGQKTPPVALVPQTPLLVSATYVADPDPKTGQVTVNLTGARMIAGETEFAVTGDGAPAPVPVGQVSADQTTATATVLLGAGAKGKTFQVRLQYKDTGLMSPLIAMPTSKAAPAPAAPAPAAPNGP